MTLVRKRLHQLGRVVTGKTPPTARQELFQGEYLFVTPSDLDYNHYYCRSAERTVSEQAKATLRNQFIPANAVMFTCIGATIGKCGIAPAECLTNQQINSVIANDECDPKFLYYLLCNSVDIVKGMGGGAATPIVNKSKFENIDFLVPPLSQQQEIGRILSAFDDMIENNRRRIALLEEAARLLYREWFVHFRFPGHEHVPLAEGLPVGWERKRISELAEIYRGKSYASSELLDEGGQPFVNLKCFERGGGFRVSGLKWFRGEHKEHHRVNVGDIVVAVTDMTRDAMIVAQAARIPPTVGENAIFSMDLVKAVPRVGFDPFWLYGMLRFSRFSAEVREEATGATVLHLKPKHIENWMTVVPTRGLRELFSEQYGGIIAQVDNLELQVEKLAQARDILLPRLMNGEIAV